MMDLAGAFGRMVALVGAGTVMLRHRNGAPQQEAMGGAPADPAGEAAGPSRR